MREFITLRKNKVHKFKPKIEIESERGPFILKTVSTPDELIEALRLRYQVFHREMHGTDSTKARGIDVDSFDFVCDHLVIKDKKSNRVVGTYRLNCSLFSNQWYSANEFSLRRILEVPGVKLELGRACIEKEYRKGPVIALLWRGIAEYMNATGAELLFGCASINTQSARQAALLYHLFSREGRFNSETLCPPTMKYSMPHLPLWIQALDREFTELEIAEAEELIPPLCRAYLKAGASLGGEPAWDEEFQCIDFLTILPRENLNRALWRKYNLCQNQEASNTADANQLVIA